MAASHSSISPLNAATFLLLLLLFALSTVAQRHAIHVTGLNVTVVNNCPYTVRPTISSKCRHQVPKLSNVALPTLKSRSFRTTHPYWSGRIWATGNCAGRLECGGETPPTQAHFAVKHPFGLAIFSYGVSLAHDSNVPITIIPQGDRSDCPSVGYCADPATCTYEYDKPSFMHNCSSPRVVEVIFCHK